jgi:hypothetical protein
VFKNQILFEINFCLFSHQHKVLRPIVIEATPAEIEEFVLYCLEFQNVVVDQLGLYNQSEITQFQ